MKSSNVTIPIILSITSCGTVYIMLYKIVPTFESVDEMLKCD